MLYYRMRHAIVAILLACIVTIYCRRHNEAFAESCDTFGVTSCVPYIYGMNNSNTVAHMKRSCREYCYNKLDEAAKKYKNKDDRRGSFCKNVARHPEACIHNVAYKRPELQNVPKLCPASCYNRLLSARQAYEPSSSAPTRDKFIRVVYARPSTITVGKVGDSVQKYAFGSDKSKALEKVKIFVDTCQERVAAMTKGKKFKIHEEVLYLGPENNWRYTDGELFGDIDVDNVADTIMPATKRQALNDAIIAGLGGDTESRGEGRGNYSPHDIYVVLYDGGRHKEHVQSCGFINVPRPHYIVQNDRLADFYKDPNDRGLKGATIVYVMLQGEYTASSGVKVRCSDHLYDDNGELTSFRHMHYVFIHEILHALGAVRPQFKCHNNPDGAMCKYPFSTAQRHDHETEDPEDIMYAGGTPRDMDGLQFPGNGYGTLFLNPESVEWKVKDIHPKLPEIWTEHNPITNPDVCKTSTFKRHPSCFFV